MTSSSGPTTLTQDSPRLTGKELRKKAPRESHAEWKPAAGRDPLKILLKQAENRVQELLPIRYGRMSASPFAFYRGGAAIMAADLAPTPATGVRVQACGDAHISNFGGYRAPDRRVIFDLNDFDETLPAPWEWDVKRMAASAVIAARENGAGKKAARKIALAAVAQYRDVMRGLSEISYLDVWYSRLNMDDMADVLEQTHGEDAGIDLRRDISKAERKDSSRAQRKLTEESDEGEPRFASRPPLLVPARELAESLGVTDADAVRQLLQEVLDQYAGTLPPDRQHLFGHYRFVDIARKVVGVGSVGTRAWVLLFLSNRRMDPLVLQVKEAQASVLAPYAGASKFRLQGRRVVEGQRLTQAASDLFLGWTRAKAPDGEIRDFYVRQLWDGKLSIDIPSLDESRLTGYVRACGGALALAHARTGDRVGIADYMGKNDSFPEAIAEFSIRYAKQNKEDFKAFTAEIEAGRIEATPGI
ncbi:MAG: DUF2252 domain-containing protein [Solirubrobacterales bacterium]|nr:DUF2252 domain-containing protein [Solirubrobacterales bacterium]MCB0861119.1 DUF2252 domain-containing protein [Solirubrobacterales bacterium]HRV59186.1 DUF2252 domain-containing protein [Solirubrobacterales bacterium]